MNSRCLISTHRWINSDNYFLHHSNRLDLNPCYIYFMQTHLVHINHHRNNFQMFIIEDNHLIPSHHNFLHSCRPRSSRSLRSCYHKEIRNFLHSCRPKELHNLLHSCHPRHHRSFLNHKIHFNETLSLLEQGFVIVIFQFLGELLKSSWWRKVQLLMISF